MNAMSILMSQELAPPVLTASVHDVRYFASLLRGVHFSNMVTITLAKSGLTVTVEDARTLQGIAFIFAEVFDEFELHTPEDGSDDGEAEEAGPNPAFQIHLNILIDCLNIYGTAGPMGAPISGNNFKRWKRAGEDEENQEEVGNRRLDAYLSAGPEKRTSMRMSYAGDGYPLTLLIAEDASGPTTTCEINTYQSEPHLDLDFDNSKVQLRIILKSSWLRDALSEFDPSCEKLTFIANPLPETGNGRGPQRQRLQSVPLLRIQADGAFGSTEMDYPNDREVLETFECNQKVSFSYRFSHLLRTLRALSSSTKTSLRIDDEGLLSLQFLMPKPHSQGTDGFVEFRCLPLDESP